MNRRTLPLAGVLFAASLAGACTYTASFARSPYVPQDELARVVASRPHKTPEQIVFVPGPPDRPYIVMGTLTAPDVEWTAHYTMQDLTEAMAVEASEVGADAVMNVRAQQNPTVVYSGSGAVPFLGL